MSDIDTIRERHKDCTPNECRAYFRINNGRPCDTRVVLDALADAHLFTVDSLAAAIHNSGEVYADCRVKENQDDLDAGLSLVRVTKDCEASYHRSRAAAIIRAAKEAERE